MAFADPPIKNSKDLIKHSANHAAIRRFSVLKFIYFYTSNPNCVLSRVYGFKVKLS